MILVKVPANPVSGENLYPGLEMTLLSSQLNVTENSGLIRTLLH
jgi:hypothetical protein